MITIYEDQPPQVEWQEGGAANGLVAQWKDRQLAGLVLFSDWYGDAPKASFFDLTKLLSSGGVGAQQMRTLVYFSLDQIGGVETILRILYNGGCMVALERRSTDHICHLIESYEVEQLISHATFLNKIISNQSHKKFDLSFLKMITCEIDTLDEKLFRQLQHTFASVSLSWAYGLLEAGLIEFQIKDNESMWFKIDDERCRAKADGDTLWIRSNKFMAGYLNVPDPLNKDGWFDTGDYVETDGLWMRIKERTSNLIHMAGKDISPTQLESALMEMEHIASQVAAQKQKPKRMI